MKRPAQLVETTKRALSHPDLEGNMRFTLLAALAASMLAGTAQGRTFTNDSLVFDSREDSRVRVGTATNFYFDVSLNGVPLLYPGHDPHLNPESAPSADGLNNSLWLPPYGYQFDEFDRFHQIYQPVEFNRAEVRSGHVTNIEMASNGGLQTETQ